MPSSTLWRPCAVVLTGAVVLAVSACSTTAPDTTTTPVAPPTSSSPAQTGVHNDADTAFARDMIVHHRQAVEMAALAPTRAADTRVKDLAGRIQKAQDPEITLMSGWLSSWGQPVPTPGGGHGGHTGMPGMMTDADMGTLSAATGQDFDRMFLQMMIRHHEGAVAMATTVTSTGTFAPAKKLAQDITAAQTAEITEMRRLLDQLG